MPRDWCLKLGSARVQVSSLKGVHKTSAWLKIDGAGGFSPSLVIPTPSIPQAWAARARVMSETTSDSHLDPVA